MNNGICIKSSKMKKKKKINLAFAVFVAEKEGYTQYFESDGQCRDDTMLGLMRGLAWLGLAGGLLSACIGCWPCPVWKCHKRA